MRRIQLVAAALTAAFLFAPTDARAQLPSLLQLGVGGGAMVPVGHMGDDFGVGFNVHGTVGLSLPALPFMLRADANFDRLGDYDGPVQLDGNPRFFSVTLNAVYYFPGIGLRPYALGGVGLYNIEAPHGDHLDKENEFGINIGGGLEFRLPMVTAYAETRLHNIFMHDEQERFVPLTVGVRF